MVPLRQSSLKIARAADVAPPPPPATSVPLPPKVSEASRPVARRVTESLDPEVPAPAASWPALMSPSTSPAPPTEWTPSWEKAAQAQQQQAQVQAQATPKKPLPWTEIKAAAGSIAGLVVVGVFVVVAIVTGGDEPAAIVPPWTLAEKQLVSDAWRQEAKSKGDVVVSAGAVVDAVARTVCRDADFPGVTVLKHGKVDAWALPDGGVVVTAGLLLALHNEAELAAVTAHVYAHAQNGDVDRLLLDHPEWKSAGTAAVAAVAGARWSIEDEVVADAVAIKELKVANWQTGALQKAVDVLGAAPAAASSVGVVGHPVDDVRRAAVVVEQQKFLSGSNAVQRGTPKENAEPYALLQMTLPRHAP